MFEEDDVEMRLARERDALWTVLLRARLSSIAARQRIAATPPTMEDAAERGVGRVVPFVRPPRRG